MSCYITFIMKTSMHGSQVGQMWVTFGLFSGSNGSTDTTHFQPWIGELLGKFVKKLVCYMRADSSLILQTNDDLGNLNNITHEVCIMIRTKCHACMQFVGHMPRHPWPLLCSYSVLWSTYHHFNSHCMKYKCANYRQSSWSINTVTVPHIKSYCSTKAYCM